MKHTLGEGEGSNACTRGNTLIISCFLEVIQQTMMAIVGTRNDNPLPGSLLPGTLILPTTNLSPISDTQFGTALPISQSTQLKCLQSAFSIEIRRGLIPASAFAKQRPMIIKMDWDETSVFFLCLACMF